MLNTFANITREAPLKKRLLPCFVFLIMFCVISCFAVKEGITPGRITAAAIFLCGLILLLIPVTGKPVFYVLSLAAAAVNYVLLNFLLVLFYYLLFTPLALLIRLFVKNQISAKWDDGKQTGWEVHGEITDLKQYFKQF